MKALHLRDVSIHSSLTFDPLHVVLLDQRLEHFLQLCGLDGKPGSRKIRKGVSATSNDVDVVQKAAKECSPSFDLLNDFVHQVGMLDRLFGLHNAHSGSLQNELSFEEHVLLRLFLFFHLAKKKVCKKSASHARKSLPSATSLTVCRSWI